MRLFLKSMFVVLWLSSISHSAEFFRFDHAQGGALTVAVRIPPAKIGTSPTWKIFENGVEMGSERYHDVQTSLTVPNATDGADYIVVFTYGAGATAKSYAGVFSLKAAEAPAKVPAPEEKANAKPPSPAAGSADFDDTAARTFVQDELFSKVRPKDPAYKAHVTKLQKALSTPGAIPNELALDKAWKDSTGISQFSAINVGNDFQGRGVINDDDNWSAAWTSALEAFKNEMKDEKGVITNLSTNCLTLSRALAEEKTRRDKAETEWHDHLLSTNSQLVPNGSTGTSPSGKCCRCGRCRRCVSGN